MDYLRNILDNREISILIWLGIFSLWLLFKKDIRKSIKDILKALTQKVILFSLLLMCLYVGGMIYLLAYWGVWDILDLSDTVIWFFGSAFVMFMNINNVGKDGYLRNVIVENLKMVALIEFITNFYVFDLWGELLLVPVLLLIGGMLGVASTDKKYKSVKNFLQKTLIFIGFVFLIYTVYNIIIDFTNFATWNNLLDFLLPLLLTVGFLPFIYLLAVYTVYDLVFNRIDHLIKFPELKRYAKWNTVLAFSIDLNRLHEWLQRIVLLELSSKDDVRYAIKEVKMRFYKAGAIYRVIKSTGLYDSQNVDAKELDTLSVGAIVKPADGHKVIQCHIIKDGNTELTLCKVEVIDTGQTGFVLKKWLQREPSPSKFLGWITKLSTKAPLKLSILISIIALIVVVSISYWAGDYSTPGYWQNVRVEAHGMLFDLLILGVFISWLNSLGEKRRRIERYREEIVDYLGWQEAPATYRIVGNIKRLNRENVSDINLHNANLEKANLLQANLEKATLTNARLKAANFNEAILMNADLSAANLRGARLIGAKLNRARLILSDLSDAKLINANLAGANLTESNLSGTDLTGAKLGGCNFNDAIYNKQTIWPEGFAPDIAGAIFKPNN